MTGADVGPLELLVIQPTPFCNLDCSYCYLPDRQNTRKMSLEMLERAFDWVFASGLVRQPFTLLWHAGEPLVMPLAFYDHAAALLARHDPEGTLVTQSLQTNGTLIDAEWCELIRRLKIHIGVSVDGPAFLHDSRRRTRQGAGTLDRVLAGIECLHAHDIPLHVITVLTGEALAYPDELFDFYMENGIADIAFNVEEIEGPNTSSSLQGDATPERFRRFLSRFLDLALSADPPLRVREFECSAGAALGKRLGHGDRIQENKPFAIVNVGCDGDFSTYYPELLGIESLRHGRFALGHIERDSLASVLSSRRFLGLDEEIAHGVEMCRQQCRYFAFCGGGPPGNKFFENGTFASTETMFCRLHTQACLDVALDKLERSKASV
jgi:uncharacterized protein